MPLKYSVDSFLLSDENDRVHRFRDALQGPIGRLTAREKQAGDWWGENANKDTQHTKEYRAAKTADLKRSYRQMALLLHPGDQRDGRDGRGWIQGGG